MPQCDGCSKVYLYMTTKRCDPCTEKANESPSAPRVQWKSCISCGKRFEYLLEDDCTVCVKRAKDDSDKMPPPPPDGRRTFPLAPRHQNDTQDVDYALKHSVDPRTYSNQGATPFDNPFQGRHHRDSHDENDPRRIRAEQHYEDYGNGYDYARLTAKNRSLSVNVAKPKFRGAQSRPFPEPPVPRVHIVLRKIINRNDEALTTVFDAKVVEYAEDQDWNQVLDNIKMYLDGLYSSQFSHRIQKIDRDFVLHYSYSKSIIKAAPPEVENDSTSDAAPVVKFTVGDFWRASIRSVGVYVQKAHVAKRILELNAIVNYPRPEDADSASTHGSKKRGAKRKDYGSTLDTGTTKRRQHTTSYFTRISSRLDAPRTPTIDEHALEVKKIRVTLDKENQEYTWTESDESFRIVIEKKSFSSGKTKHAYKICYVENPQMSFAAKTFYNLGYEGTPSVDEVDVHLKEELLRQMTMKESISSFMSQAIEKSINIHDLRMADSHLIRVCAGEEEETTFLVDPLLNHLKMCKFSGTETAGKNTDFAGMTCDALAHFTLIDSGCEFVPVDIQGIPVAQCGHDGVKGADCLVLFDIMAHSRGKSMGLGDKGVKGIKEFCMQHKCNEICRAFELENALEEFNQLEIEGEIGDDEESSNHDGALGAGSNDES